MHPSRPSRIPAPRPFPDSEDADGLTVAAELFDCLDQAVVCLDEDLRIVWASDALDRVVGEGAVEQVHERSAEEALGPALFGDEGVVRRALEAGERREGFRTTYRLPSPRRRPPLVSVAAAPLPDPAPGKLEDLGARYLVVLRPADPATMPAASISVFSGMVARSVAMVQIFRRVEELRQSTATVLIQGESGTGKELVARALHRWSPRCDGPFVAVNCGALAEGVLESELFGHVKGAFTGATQDRVGRFEAARGGTLFLDEIGDLPLTLQVKLLRVLEEQSFERVGETRPRTTDARIVAATHVNLKEARSRGRFREDLYYRLRVVTLRLPSLRERVEDIEPLAAYLLSRLASRQERDLRLASETLSLFLRYPWPGNVRELENSLEHAAAVARGPWLHPEHLPEDLLEAETELAPQSEPSGAPKVASGDPLETEPLRSALDAHQWRRAATARALGVSRSTLWRRMRELGWIR